MKTNDEVSHTFMPKPFDHLPTYPSPPKSRTRVFLPLFPLPFMGNLCPVVRLSLELLSSLRLHPFPPARKRFVVKISGNSLPPFLPCLPSYTLYLFLGSFVPRPATPMWPQPSHPMTRMMQVFAFLENPPASPFLLCLAFVLRRSLSSFFCEIVSFYSWSH